MTDPKRKITRASARVAAVAALTLGVLGALAVPTPALAASVTVANFTELAAAVAAPCDDPTEVTLDAGFDSETLVDAQPLLIGCTLTLHLNGQTLTTKYVDVAGGVTLTIADTGGGSLHAYGAPNPGDIGDPTAPERTFNPQVPGQAGIHVPSSAALVITGGTIYARGGRSNGEEVGGSERVGAGAGIGGNGAAGGEDANAPITEGGVGSDAEMSGPVTITGGEVWAFGGGSVGSGNHDGGAGAGIGGGGGGPGGTGLVGETNGGDGGAAGSGSDSGSVVISGGAVHAVGGLGQASGAGAGIGGGGGGAGGTGGGAATEGPTAGNGGNSGSGGAGGNVGNVTVSGGTLEVGTQICGLGGCGAGIGGGGGGQGGPPGVRGTDDFGGEGADGQGAAGGVGGGGLIGATRSVISFTGGSTTTVIGGDSASPFDQYGGGLGAGIGGGGGGADVFRTMVAVSGPGADVSIAAGATVSAGGSRQTDGFGGHSGFVGSAIGAGGHNDGIDSFNPDFGELTIDGTLILTTLLHLPSADSDVTVSATGLIRGQDSDPTGGAVIEGAGSIANAGVIALTADRVLLGSPAPAGVTGNNFVVTFVTTSPASSSDVQIFAPQFVGGFRTFPAPPDGLSWTTEPDGTGTVFTDTTPITANLTVYAAVPTVDPDADAGPSADSGAGSSGGGAVSDAGDRLATTGSSVPTTVITAGAVFILAAALLLLGGMAVRRRNTH